MGPDIKMVVHKTSKTPIVVSKYSAIEGAGLGSVAAPVDESVAPTTDLSRHIDHDAVAPSEGSTNPSEKPPHTETGPWKTNEKWTALNAPLGKGSSLGELVRAMLYDSDDSDGPPSTDIGA